QSGQSLKCARSRSTSAWGSSYMRRRAPSDRCAMGHLLPQGVLGPPQERADLVCADAERGADFHVAEPAVAEREDRRRLAGQPRERPADLAPVFLDLQHRLGVERRLLAAGRVRELAALSPAPAANPVE